MRYFFKIKQLFSNIHILNKRFPRTYCVVYGCDSIYKKSILEVISHVSTPVFIEAGYFYLNIYRFLLVFPTFIKIVFKSEMRWSFRSFSIALKVAFLFQVIQSYKPRVVLTYLDNDSIFQFTARISSNIKFFCIQNGSRGIYDIEAVPNLNLVNFFCFNNYVIKFLSQSGYKANRWLPIGSFMSSFFIKHISEKSNFIKEFDICLVSQWRLSFYLESKNNPFFYSFKKMVDELLDCLSTLLKLNAHIKACIALCSEDEREYSLYKDKFLDRCLILKKDKNYEWTSYEAIAKSKITISINSTMLEEALDLNSIPLGYNSSGDPLLNASLPDLYLANSKEQFTEKIHHNLLVSSNLDSLDISDLKTSNTIPAYKVIQNAVKFGIGDSPQLFEEYLDQFSYCQK
ncbi:hypothetical protein AXG55_11885 [Silvanigrella aquatica]|uniref:UDP-N-acetylglucosamine 2-epimerase domain-containing protein n=2 Tax=Silvanigrella aquatica TaxID=1915309 RepID=A0A1L4D301_9BACT|nr:hypothetical protein AXG55_11885 [Silvanigrella aquatica]